MIRSWHYTAPVAGALALLLMVLLVLAVVGVQPWIW